VSRRVGPVPEPDPEVGLGAPSAAESVPVPVPVTGPGHRLDELVGVVDALLAADGGCAWNRAQTPESLVTYLIEETAELVEAIEVGSPVDRREELGDVLYQVVLHSALAARASSQPFDLADVVVDVTAKTVRRHPHVFGSDNADDLDDIVRLWSAAKAHEKSSRASAFDGVPLGLASLARAQKLESRRVGAGLPRPELPESSELSELPESSEPSELPEGDGAASRAEIAWGRALLHQVDEASDRGIDAERALRAAVREREEALRADEALRRDAAPALDEEWSRGEGVPPQPE